MICSEREVLQKKWRDFEVCFAMNKKRKSMSERMTVEEREVEIMLP